MKKKTCGILSEQELKKLLKMEIHFTGMCYSCPLNDISINHKMSCVRVMQRICGKTSNRCSEAIMILRNFINKFKQNKI